MAERQEDTRRYFKRKVSSSKYAFEMLTTVSRNLSPAATEALNMSVNMAKCKGKRFDIDTLIEEEISGLENKKSGLRVKDAETATIFPAKTFLQKLTRREHLKTKSSQSMDALLQINKRREVVLPTGDRGKSGARSYAYHNAMREEFATRIQSVWRSKKARNVVSKKAKIRTSGALLKVSCGAIQGSSAQDSAAI